MVSLVELQTNSDFSMEGGMIKRFTMVFVIMGLMFFVATEAIKAFCEQVIALYVNPCTLEACTKECKATVGQTFLKAYCKSDTLIVCICFGLQPCH